MFPSAILAALASALIAQQVTAQLGVTYVMSRDGNTEYPCSPIVEPETYYQDKCPATTVSGRSIIATDVRNNVGNPRDGGDWTAYLFCYYGTGRDDYCYYTATKASPSLVSSGTGLAGDCRPISSSAAYYAPGTAPEPAPPAASPAVVQSDGMHEPDRVCPTLDGSLQNSRIYKYSPRAATDPGYDCAYANAPYCYYDTYGVYNGGEGNPGVANCPSQLCPNHLEDNTVTRRRSQNPAISTRQVKARDLRKASTSYNGQRSKRFDIRR